MRIFNYWKSYTKELVLRNEKIIRTVYGGSNISEEDTRYDADKKFEKIRQNSIHNIRTDYDVDIREEIFFKINDNNVITRNRYGALVLNCKNLMIIDVDSYKKSFLEYFFKSKSSLKDLMFEKIKNTIHKDEYRYFGFRVYETFKGFRIIISSKEIEPRTVKSDQIMKDFNADLLYRKLCVTQNCFRARLTPKPQRINHRMIKFTYPITSERQREKYLLWVTEYNKKCENYSTCNLVFTYGNSSATSIITLHDNYTKVKSNLSLA